MKKIFIISVLFLWTVVSLGGYAQNLVSETTLTIPRTVKDETQLPSPEAAQMNRYVDYPVDYSTGAATVNVPLYEMTVGNFSLPLSLSYHTSGIKVEDEDCMVGLGWSLQGLGCVTRVIHGRPDEQASTFEIKKASTVLQQNNISYLSNVLHRETEAQYDRYYYHVSGYSGSFIIQDGTITQLPQSDVKIERYGPTTDGVRDFLLTTPDGCRYYFTARETTQYSYTPVTLSSLNSVYHTPNYTAVTGWHLTSIVTPSRTDTISITYTTTSHTRTNTPDKLRSRYFSATGNSVNTGVDSENVYATATLTYANKRIPSMISSRSCTVNFTVVPKSSSNAYAHLSGMQVVSSSNTIVRQITLSTSTFPGGRICLDGVSITSGNVLLDSHTFTYFSGNSSRNKDFFGYNNSTTGNNTRFYHSILGEDGLPSGDREYNFSSARGLALKTITDATGAVTTYEYEANTCPNGSYDVSIGLRLKSITTSDPVMNRSRQRRFLYENGQPTIDFNSLQVGDFISLGGLISYSGLRVKTHTTGATFTASCRVPGMQAENATIYYGRVTELVGGTGIADSLKTVYEYDLTDIGHPYVNVSQNLPNVDITSTNERYLGTHTYSYNPSDGPLFARVFSPYFISGHFRETCWEKAPLVRKSVYAYRNGVYSLREKVENRYSLLKEDPIETGFFVTPTTRNIQAINNIQITEVLQYTKDFNFMETTLQRGRLYRDTTIVTRYFDNGQQRTVTTAFRYNDTPTGIIPPWVSPVDGFPGDSLRKSDLRLIQSIKTTCGTHSLNRYFCYTSNLKGARYWAITDSGYIALPVMEKVVADGTDVVLTYNTYRTFQRPVNLQLSQRTLYYNGTEMAVQDFHDYDVWGNLLATTVNHGMPVSYAWGYDHSLPVKAVRGSTNSSQTGNTVLTTSYLHAPLIGCTRITGPDGLYRQFSYSGGRLSAQTNLSGQTAVSYAYSLYKENSNHLNMTGQTVYTASSQASGITTQTFYDGLGLPVNAVAKDVTPSHADLVTLTAYDGIDRKTEEFLPVPLSSVSAVVKRPAVLSAATTFYSDARPWQAYDYEQSAGGELLQESPAGTAFYSHPTERELMGSTTSSSLYQCRRFTLSGDYVLTADGLYADGELQVEKVTDGDGRSLLVFTDYRGTKVLERRVLGSGSYADTYYVCDALGDVRFVLPPALQGMQNVSGSSWNIRTNTALRQFAYFYRYDSRRDCVEKKLPGAESVYYLCDITHTPVFSQDGNQRSAGKWQFTLPDRFGRPALQGLCGSPSASAVASQWVYATTPDYSNYNSTICQTGYGSSLSLSSPQLLSATYYDDHGFLSLPAFSLLTPVATTRSYRGLQTGMLTAVLPSGTSQCSVTYYDVENRPSQVQATNIRGGVDTETLTYTFDGRPLTRTVSHGGPDSQVLAACGADLETFAYSYDHAGRLLTLTHQLDGQTTRPLLSNTYDELGRLLTTTRGGTVTTTNGYNLHGWLTSSESTPFKEYLYYEQSHNGSSAQYGGNISAVDWKTSDNVLRGYAFTYDGLSRLTQAGYFEGGSASSKFGTQYTYDLMGNMQTLKRYGLLSNNTYGLIDDLSYTYSGNQVTKVTDAVTSGPSYAGAFHFIDGSNATTEYEYDNNGNLTKDLNKNISSIQYNSLNLPSSINYQNGNMASYVYSAAGGKLSVSYQTGTGNTSTQYCGNIIYDNNNLSQVLIDGGYITFSGTTPQYHYYLQDHLGSNRVVVNESGTAEQVTHYYPFGGLMGNSTNGDMQHFKYNGKELDCTHGLDWYDYGARHFDAAIGCWHTTDPLCEKYYSLSPYNYCGGNPIRFIDIDGFVWKDINGNIIKNHDGIKVYIFYDKDAFTMQSYAMYKEAERIYGKGSVALSDAMTTNSFEEDWKNMASNNIAEVNLNYHGNNQTIFLNASKGEYLTATGNGFTNTQPQSRRVAADNVQDLPNPIGNISHAQLNINSCRSNSTNQKPLLGSGKTLMKVFADSFIFQAVRGTSVGVSYSRWDLLPHPQYLASEGWFKNWEYIGQPIQIPAAAPVFKFTDALYFKTGGMK